MYSPICCGSLTFELGFDMVPLESTSTAKLVKCFAMHVMVVEFGFSNFVNTPSSDHPPVTLLLCACHL